VAAAYRRLAIVALLAVTALLLLAAASSWLIVRVWGPSLTASQLASAISEATGRRAHVDRVAIEPLLGRVRILGLTVSDKAETSRDGKATGQAEVTGQGEPRGQGAVTGQGEPMAAIERVDVRIRIESLWRLELVVGAAAQGVRLRLRPDPDAKPVTRFEVPERIQLGPITIRLASIRVERCRLHFEDPAARLTLEVNGLGAEGRPDRGGLELTARAETFALHVANFSQKLERLAAEGRIDSARILARRLEAGGEHHIEVTGAIESPWSKTPTLAGEAKARVALGPLAQGLGATVAVGGTASVDLTLGGRLAAPVIAGPVRTERLDVAGIEARDVSATLRLDEQALAFPDVAALLLGARLQGSLAMPLGRPNDTLVRVRLDGADAGTLARLGGGTLDLRGRLTLDGEARGDLARPLALSGHIRMDGTELSLPGALARLGAGHLRVSARMAGGQIDSDVEGQWPSAMLTARARVEPDQRLRVEAKATAGLGALPGWAPGDSVDVTARAEGRWPQTTLTAAVDLARAPVGAGAQPGGRVAREAGRVDLRLDPVAGPAPRWTGSIRSRRLSLPSVEIADLQSALALSSDALEVSRVAARVASIPVEGSGRWAWRGAGDARLVAGPVALARLPGVPPDLALDGSARAQIEVSAGAAGVQGTARVEAERVGVAGIALGRGSGEATVRGQRLDASLRFPERQLEMFARGDLGPGQTLTARAELRSLDLASLSGPTPGPISPTAPPPGPAARTAPAPSAGAAPTPTPPSSRDPLLRGTISASADVAIPVDAPARLKGTVAIHPGTVAVAGSSWTSAGPIVARLDGQRATLDPARLSGPAGTLAAGGVLWDAAARPLVSVKLDVARLAALAPALGLDGRVRASAELTGDAGAVAGSRAQARIEGDGLALPGPLAALGTGTSHIDLQLAGRVVTVSRADAAFRGLDSSITGRIDLAGPVALDAQATAQAARLGPALGLGESSGTATATATVRGTLAKPEVHARLASERIALAGVAAERLDASLRLRGETWHLERLTARVLGAPLRAQGEWTPPGTGRAELEAGPLALGQIAGLPERLALGGALSLRAEGSSERGAVKAAASAEVRDARVAGLSLGAGRLTASVDGRRLQANLDLAGRRITGSASGALEPGGAVDAALDLATLDLGPVIRHFSAGADTGMEASVAGRLTARMPWDQPGALAVRARFEPVAVRVPGANVEAKGHIAASWESATLRIEGAELTGTAGTARARGSLGPGGRLDATLDARMPLAALLAPVTDVSGAEGTVAAQAQVTGTLAEPIVRGEGSLTGGRLALRGLPTALRDITARAVATPGSIHIADARASLGSGTIQAAGEASLSARTLGGYRLRITARDIPLRPLEGLDTHWNADLDFTGAAGRSLLSGEARLVRGTYSRDLITLSALTEPRQAAGGPRGEGIPLNVRVNLDDNLLVRTSMARMRVGGTLTVRGTTAAPIVLGAIEARDGTLVLRGQRYQLERAVVRFTDPRRIEPILDVTATARIRDYDVTMRVTGRIRDLDMRLSSSPSLPQDQLLSLVAFGTTSGETGQGGALAGEAAGLVIRELLDLSGGENPLPAPLRAIMERTRVSYTHNADDLGRFGFRLEYEVAGPFLLVGERTGQGYYIIDGVVRLRFR
jgi:autotransporter translocation and assembly factor TamB